MSDWKATPDSTGYWMQYIQYPGERPLLDLKYIMVESTMTIYAASPKSVNWTVIQNVHKDYTLWRKWDEVKPPSV